jgi:hypothetical protein
MSEFIYESDDGDVRVWLEQEAVYVKIVDKYGDPVELTSEEALKLASILRRYAEECA